MEKLKGINSGNIYLFYHLTFANEDFRSFDETVSAGLSTLLPTYQQQHLEEKYSCRYNFSTIFRLRWEICFWFWPKLFESFAKTASAFYMSSGTCCAENKGFEKKCFLTMRNLSRKVSHFFVEFFLRLSEPASYVLRGKVEGKKYLERHRFPYHFPFVNEDVRVFDENVWAELSKMNFYSRTDYIDKN